MMPGFSKLSREEKVGAVIGHCGLSVEESVLLNRYLHPEDQGLFDGFSENTLSNYYLPYGVAPGFVINGREYVVPMVTEESSVVAAAAKGAAFWAARGGFHSRVVDTVKVGQIIFSYTGGEELLRESLPALRKMLPEVAASVTRSMQQRGGGISGMGFHPIPGMENMWQLRVEFQTADSMGANFINSCLELMAPELESFLNNSPLNNARAEVIMSILSNYTPDCRVECSVECDVQELAAIAGDYSAEEFTRRFQLAVQVAQNDVYRAVTHNKGIQNGVDAVVLATGNDFRAVEAGVHAFATAGGSYSSLTRVSLTDRFCYTLSLPLALGTVGGLTRNHPLAALSLRILQQPDARQLMQIAAAVGLANNFMAVASLITHGIQRGHMKLHLTNILQSLQATETEKRTAINHFAKQTVSFSAVQGFINQLRSV